VLILHTVVDTVMDMFIFDTHTFGSVIDSVLYKVCLQAKEKKICVSANPAFGLLLILLRFGSQSYFLVFLTSHQKTKK
jgi:hypothetical protein